jgi:hypothetical protein
MRGRIGEFIALVMDDIVERLRQVRIERKRPAAGRQRRVAVAGEAAGRRPGCRC